MKMNKKQKDYGFIFWIHLVLNLIAIFSWLFFSWWIIVIGEIMLQLQYFIFNGCILSRAEFGRDEACVPYYLMKWRIVRNKKRARFFVRNILPLIVIIFGIIWQVLLRNSPWTF